MKTYIAKIVGTTPYSQGRAYEVPKLEKESPDAYEVRTWRNRMHAAPDDDTGEVYIPPTAFKNCLSDAARFLSKPVKGKGKATYTKHFEAGVIVAKPVPLGVKRGDVQGIRCFVPSDGRRGGGSRVYKVFPIINEWSCEVEIIVADETITKEVLHEHLREAGMLIGIGRFRPRNNGYYGRFNVESLEEVA